MVPDPRKQFGTIVRCLGAVNGKIRVSPGRGKSRFAPPDSQHYRHHSLIQGGINSRKLVDRLKPTRKLREVWGRGLGNPGNLRARGRWFGDILMATHPCKGFLGEWFGDYDFSMTERVCLFCFVS